jgi:hypothetical protein
LTKNSQLGTAVVGEAVTHGPWLEFREG